MKSNMKGKEFYHYAAQIQEDCSKILENQDLPHEVVMEVLNREIELADMVKKEARRKSPKKLLLCGVSLAAGVILGLGIAISTMTIEEE